MMNITRVSQHSLDTVGGRTFVEDIHPPLDLVAQFEGHKMHVLIIFQLNSRFNAKFVAKVIGPFFSNEDALNHLVSIESDLRKDYGEDWSYDTKEMKPTMSVTIILGDHQIASHIKAG
jgi:hypothetical protein